MLIFWISPPHEFNKFVFSEVFWFCELCATIPCDVPAEYNERLTNNNGRLDYKVLCTRTSQSSRSIGKQKSVILEKTYRFCFNVGQIKFLRRRSISWISHMNSKWDWEERWKRRRRNERGTFKKRKWNIRYNSYPIK